MNGFDVTIGVTVDVVLVVGCAIGVVDVTILTLRGDIKSGRSVVIPITFPGIVVGGSIVGGFDGVVGTGG